MFVSPQPDMFTCEGVCFVINHFVTVGFPSGKCLTDIQILPENMFDQTDYLKHERQEYAFGRQGFIPLSPKGEQFPETFL